VKKILKKIWRAFVIFWTGIGIIVSIFSVVGLISLLTSKQFSNPSPSDFCKQNPIGSSFKAMDISSKIQNVKKISAALSSPIGPVIWGRQNQLEEKIEKAKTILLEIDKQGLRSTFRLTDSLGFLKRTCIIDFENRVVIGSHYSTWD
jgi:hypothetical protein